MDPSGVFFTNYAGDRSLIRTRAQWASLDGCSVSLGSSSCAPGSTVDMDHLPRDVTRER